MSQQEDDLRALAKIMDFLRAVSIILVVVHLYWYGYEAVRLWGIDIGVVDRMLVNFDRTAGLFHHILYTKLFALLLLALSCLGTKGVKEEKITWGRIWAVLAAGLVLFFGGWWMLSLPLPVEANVAFYAASMAAGYVCLLMSGTWMSRLLRTNLMDDVFNVENESFMQETRLRERVFGEPAHALLLQEEVELWVYQRGKPVPSHYRAGHSGQRKVVCCGKQFHQATD